MDLEKENPLYQNYAKYYHGSTSLGPYWRLLENDTLTGNLSLQIIRHGQVEVEYNYSLENGKRSYSELGQHLFEDRQFPFGACLFYGCNSRLPEKFSLQPGDELELKGSFLPDPLRNTFEGVTSHPT